MDCITLLLVAVLAAIFIYYYCGQKSNLLADSSCRYEGGLALNGPDPNVWPNCYIPGRM
jgi:hypothetical protein